MQLSEILQKIDAKVIWPDREERDLEISGVAPLDKAKKGDISFLTNPKWAPSLKTTEASAVLLAQAQAQANVKTIQIVTKNPYADSAKIAYLFFEYEHHFKGQSSLAFIDADAHVDKTADIFPFAYISAGAQVKAGAILYPNTFVGAGAIVGENSILFPGVCVMNHCIVGKDNIIHANTVIGADGFGFAPSEEKMHKIPQTGISQTEDDVEIGALCSVDRATFETTLIKKGSKLDSHVHVGHNVEVGEHAMLCAQAGIAGSSKLGDRVIMAGQAGIGPGLNIPSQVVLGARCAMVQEVKEPGEYLGMPARPSKEWARQMAALKKLPEVLKRLQKLEKMVDTK